MYDIFISYSSQNDKQVEAIRQTLEKNGFSCWFAPFNIRGHQDFTNVIPDAIKSSKAFLLLLSEEAQSSRWVQRELGVADDNDIPIYTLFLEDCELTERFKFILRYNQHYSIPKDGNSAMEKLINELKDDFAATLKGSSESKASDLNGGAKGNAEPKRNKKALIISAAAVILAILAVFACVFLFAKGNKETEYLISCPAYDIALSAASAQNPHYLAGKDLSDAGSASDCRWQITHLSDGTVTISQNGVNLGIQPGYNGIGLGGNYTADKWKIIEDTDGCVYIQNTETLSYLEWYADKGNWANHDKLTPETKTMFLLKTEKVK